MADNNMADDSNDDDDDDSLDSDQLREYREELESLGSFPVSFEDDRSFDRSHRIVSSAAAATPAYAVAVVVSSLLLLVYIWCARARTIQCKAGLGRVAWLGQSISLPLGCKWRSDDRVAESPGRQMRWRAVSESTRFFPYGCVRSFHSRAYHLWPIFWM